MEITIIITLLGGLGLFLYGMRVMSDSIEAFAGARLRGILEKLTTNRFMGILVGLIFTATIQSSSACTVMVVSFVNSGLMNLTQAAGVIFGSNIGTTVTALLVSFMLWQGQRFRAGAISFSSCMCLHLIYIESIHLAIVCPFIDGWTLFCNE